jgi:ADP-heptose:LPS heptosyltransferase
MTFRRNVLIFHQGALGDFVLTWPLALAAGRVFAQSRVIYVTAAQKGALAERVLRIESTDAEGGWHTLYADGQPTLPERATRLLDGSHLIFTFAAEPGDRWTQNVGAVAPAAQVVCLHTKTAEDAAVHVTEFVRRQLEPTVPAMHAAVAQMLRSINERGVSGIRENPGGPIVIHPGSGAARKCWPADRFVELAEHLKHDGHAVEFVLGEVEREQWPAQRVERLGSVSQIAEPKTYLELYDLLQSAQTFVGNDTGPTHLAAITGVNTVALFGNNPSRWGPIGPRIRVVRRDGIESIHVDDVLDAIVKPRA